MPVVQVSKADSREQYEEVARLLELDARTPDGLIVHAASETADGTVEIVDVWESAAQLQAFAQERLFPAFAATGLMPMLQDRPQPVPYEPFEYVRG